MQHQSIAIQADTDLEQLRARLRKMTDSELCRFGRSASFMCSPDANLGKPPRESFVIQFEEARAEWRRRKESGGAPSASEETGPAILD